MIFLIVSPSLQPIILNLSLSLSCGWDLLNLSQQSVTFEIDNIRIHIEAALFHGGGKSSMESLKVELACLYYLQLPPEKRSKGRNILLNFRTNQFTLIRFCP